MKKTDLIFVIAILSSLCVIFFIIMVGQNAEINSLKNREVENVTGVFHLLSYNRFYNLDEENPNLSHNASGEVFGDYEIDGIKYDIGFHSDDREEIIDGINTLISKHFIDINYKSYEIPLGVYELKLVNKYLYINGHDGASIIDVTNGEIVKEIKNGYFYNTNLMDKKDNSLSVYNVCEKNKLIIYSFDSETLKNEKKIGTIKDINCDKKAY